MSLIAVDIKESVAVHHGLDMSVTMVDEVENEWMENVRPVKKAFIREKNRNARLRFAKEHFSWTIRWLQKMLFSEESSFKLFVSEAPHYARHPKDITYDRMYQLPATKHGREY